MSRLDSAAEVVVAGHVCLDVLPEITHAGPLRFEPGTLAVVGPVTLSTGGCVPNTGIALHRLGVRVRLIGKVGEDPFGQVVKNLLAEIDPRLADDLVVSPGDRTSYSVIVSPPDADRMFLHFPGANSTFGADNVPERGLQDARILHAGYLPLLNRMYEKGGTDLKRLLTRAKTSGLATSMDMSYPDPASEAGRVEWAAILREVLPYVDFFLPSLDELHLMLKMRRAPEEVEPEIVRELAAEVLALGAGAVGIKLGDRGFYLRTASPAVMSRIGRRLGDFASDWGERELWAAAFEVKVAGTTGAGDAAIAGLLMGLLRGMTPEATVKAACAVGACSVERPEAGTGVVSWEATTSRVDRGWRRATLRLGHGWMELERGVWAGPADRVSLGKEVRKS